MADSAINKRTEGQFKEKPTWSVIYQTLLRHTGDYNLEEICVDCINRIWQNKKDYEAGKISQEEFEQEERELTKAMDGLEGEFARMYLYINGYQENESGYITDRYNQPIPFIDWESKLAGCRDLMSEKQSDTERFA